jgi:hypothetical protein
MDDNRFCQLSKRTPGSPTFNAVIAATDGAGRGHLDKLFGVELCYDFA